jgi:hypothetical protein
VVELASAFGDFGGVSSHGGDGEGRGLDGFCGRFDGRPAGGIGTGSGGLVDVAGHVHFKVEARSGSAAMEVHLAGSDGHSHGLFRVSTRNRVQGLRHGVLQVHQCRKCLYMRCPRQQQYIAER